MPSPSLSFHWMVYVGVILDVLCRVDRRAFIGCFISRAMASFHWMFYVDAACSWCYLSSSVSVPSFHAREAAG